MKLGVTLRRNLTVLLALIALVMGLMVMGSEPARASSICGVHAFQNHGTSIHATGPTTGHDTLTPWWSRGQRWVLVGFYTRVAWGMPWKWIGDQAINCGYIA